MTLAVVDPWFDDNSATFEVGPDGVRRSGASPDVRCPIDALSAAFLGTVPWYDLLVAGRIDASPEAAARADDLFAVRPQAFCGSFF